MSLRTDYKNDIYTGKRKYLLTDNGDGTYTIDDVTAYVQDGDVFSADDINATNKAVNKNIDDIAQVALDLVNGLNDLKNVKYATFPANGWSASVPFTQTVSVAGILETDTPIVALSVEKGLSKAAESALEKAFGYVSVAETGNGTLTMYCNSSRPETTFTVAIKGE